MSKPSPDLIKGLTAAKAIVSKQRAETCRELIAAEKDYREAMAVRRKTRETLISAKAKLAAFEEAIKLAENEETKEP